ncbi:hypothetical protein EDB19DRAFT_1775696 [Suillus lakei]|nr:hypothetical protein EDB19DRAFT_1775696 [Suillus lakei]
MLRLGGFVGDLSCSSDFIIAPHPLPNSQLTSQARAFAVLKWFISTLIGQYTSRNDSMWSEKNL